KYAEAGREPYPPEVRFVTWTLKYPKCAWVRILALEKHFEETTVRARRQGDGFEVKTRNVRRLRLDVPAGVPRKQQVVIDGDRVEAAPEDGAITLEKSG